MPGLPAFRTIAVVAGPMTNRTLFGLFGILCILTVSACLHSPPGVIYPCDPPTVIEVHPHPQEHDTPLDDTIIVIFDQPMDTTSGDSNTITLVQGADTIPGDVFWSPCEGTLAKRGIILPPEHCLHFDPHDDLLPDSPYVVIVIPGFEDTAGTMVEDTSIWTFTTVDTTTQPELPPDVDIYPEPGGDSIPVDVVIEITFDTLWNPSVFDTNDIVLTLGGDTIPGTTVWVPDDTALVFTPDDPLLPDTTYTTIITIPTDSLTPGGPVDTVITTTFTTVENVPDAPLLEAVPDGSSLSISGHPQPSLKHWWYSPPGPTPSTYRLQISTSPSFMTTVYDQPGIPNTSTFMNKAVPLSSLPPATYYWRLSATGQGGSSPWSAVWSYTTTP